uniref:Integrase catalytic domain-containing protein n=1 Tax=Haemonchus placei TaxID=6290 RepID=A0A0N4WYK3_HAEPC
LKHCVTCGRFNTVPFKYPNMGPLPTVRVTQSPPFAQTAVVFMGPITVKSISGEDFKLIGVPVKIISDNGTNFRLTEHILSQNATMMKILTCLYFSQSIE